MTTFRHAPPFDPEEADLYRRDDDPPRRKNESRRRTILAALLCVLGPVVLFLLVLALGAYR